MIYAVLLALFAAPLAAVAANSAADYDLNGDGKLAQAELKVFLMHANEIAFSDIDTDRDGAISAAERDAYIAPLLADAIDQLGDKSEYALDEIKDLYRLDDHGEPTSLDLLIAALDLKIGESHEEVFLTEKLAELTRPQPADLAFTRNLDDDSDTWQVKGAVVRPIKLDEQNPLQVDKWTTALVPSAYLHKVGTGGDGDVDDLIFRLGLDAEETDGAWYWRYNLAAAYGTDTAFDRAVKALEFSAEPLSLNAGLNKYRPFIPDMTSLQYRIRIYAHSEFGEVSDNGGDDDIAEGTFFRLGPKARIETKPSLEGSELTADFAYLFGIEGSPGSSFSWSVGFSVPLDPEGHKVLKTEYARDHSPLTQKRQDTFGLSLGLK